MSINLFGVLKKSSIQKSVYPVSAFGLDLEYFQDLQTVTVIVFHQIPRLRNGNKQTNYTKSLPICQFTQFNSSCSPKLIPRVSSHFVSQRALFLSRVGMFPKMDIENICINRLYNIQ